MNNVALEQKVRDACGVDPTVLFIRSGKDWVATLDRDCGRVSRGSVVGIAGKKGAAKQKLLSSILEKLPKQSSPNGKKKGGTTDESKFREVHFLTGQAGGSLKVAAIESSMGKVDCARLAAQYPNHGLRCRDGVVSIAQWGGGASKIQTRGQKTADRSGGQSKDKGKESKVGSAKFERAIKTGLKAGKWYSPNEAREALGQKFDGNLLKFLRGDPRFEVRQGTPIQIRKWGKMLSSKNYAAALKGAMTEKVWVEVNDLTESCVSRGDVSAEQALQEHGSRLEWDGSRVRKIPHVLCGECQKHPCECVCPSCQALEDECECELDRDHEGAPPQEGCEGCTNAALAGYPFCREHTQIPCEGCQLVECECEACEDCGEDPCECKCFHCDNAMANCQCKKISPKWGERSPAGKPKSGGPSEAPQGSPQGIPAEPKKGQGRNSQDDRPAGSGSQSAPPSEECQDCGLPECDCNLRQHTTRVACGENICACIWEGEQRRHVDDWSEVLVKSLPPLGGWINLDELGRRLGPRTNKTKITLNSIVSDHPDCQVDSANRRVRLAVRAGPKFREVLALPPGGSVRLSKEDTDTFTEPQWGALDEKGIVRVILPDGGSFFAAETSDAKVQNRSQMVQRKLIAAQRNGELAHFGPDDLYNIAIGTRAVVTSMGEDGSFYATLEGTE